MSEITVKVPANKIKEAAEAKKAAALADLAAAMGKAPMHINVVTAAALGIKTDGLPIYR